MSVNFQDWGLVPYSEAYERQVGLVGARIEGKADDTVVFVEHPAVYTLGLRPEAQTHLVAGEDFLKEHGIEVVKTNRGGDITHHAPGQLVVYPIIKLAHKDLHRYLRELEEVIIRALGMLGLAAGRVEGKTGVWVGGLQKGSPTPNGAGKRARKIAAIGVAVRQWVTYHGAAINVTNDLRLFQGIVPCGIADAEVTSLQRELRSACPSLLDVKQAVREAWGAILR